MADTNISVSLLPGEQVIVETLKLVRVLIEGQSPEQKKEIWKMVLDDWHAWRQLWGLEKRI